MRRAQALLTEQRRFILPGLSLALVAVFGATVLFLQFGSVAPTPVPTVVEEAASAPGPVRLPTPWRVPPTPGWVTYRSPDGAYAFSTPPEWTALTFADQATRERLVSLAAEIPGWSSYLEGAADAGLWEQIEVLVVGPDATRFTISHQTLPQPVSLDFYAGLVESQIVALGASDVSIDQVTLSGQDAIRIRFRISFLDESDSEVEVRGELVLTILGSGVYLLTFTAPQELHTRYAPLFGEMAARFQLQSAAAEGGLGAS